MTTFSVLGGILDGRGHEGPSGTKALGSRLEDPGAVVSGRVFQADGTPVTSGVVTYANVISPEDGSCDAERELLDAFPVHLIEIGDDIREVYVDIDSRGGGSAPVFREVLGDPSSDAILGYLQEFSVKLPKGYRTEINLTIQEWLRSAADVLSEGFILTVDYGYPSQEYYSEERNRGTLLCYFRHQRHENPYTNIGHQDVTAHVNFSSVKKWGESFGFRTLGFCQQGIYLISLGIDRVIQELFSNSDDYLFEVDIAGT